MRQNKAFANNLIYETVQNPQKALLEWEYRLEGKEEKGTHSNAVKLRENAYLYPPLILTFSLKGEGTKPLNLTALGTLPFLINML